MQMRPTEESDKRFYIQESSVPNAGRGVFAKTDIEKGSHLEIVGVLVKAGSISNTCTAYANDYKFASSPSMESYIVPTGFGGMVNLSLIHI